MINKMQKILFAIVPLLWGYFMWFMAWGIGGSLITYFPLNWLVRIIFAFVFIILFFKISLNNALDYKVQFFDYDIKIPSWWYFAILALIACYINFTSLHKLVIIQSLVYGVTLSAIIEELLTRSFFIKYKMGFGEFFFLNLLSSVTFTLMHCFYEDGMVSILELFQNRGHFLFSFALGIIAYKTQRIEITIILHMLSNLARYTLPALILNNPYPSLIWTLCNVPYEILFYLCLTGTGLKKKD